MTFFGDSSIGTISGWLNGLGRRQQAVSNNIANIDTPGYRAKDVAFETELRRAIGRGEAQLRTTDPRHISTAGTGQGQLGVQGAQRLTSQRLDSNDVDIDQEMVKLAETQMRYQAATSALNTKLGTLRRVIRS